MMRDDLSQSKLEKDIYLGGICTQDFETTNST